jgi:orotidine-5'-phosphate decarboxylase
MIELNEKESEARKKVCLPLDGLHTIEEVRQRVQELAPYVGLFKVGKESFVRFGPEVVRLVREAGSEVFLDLKFHDIPNTVRGAAEAAVELGVFMFNIHASGGLEMMRAAVQGAAAAAQRTRRPAPRVVAVTVLTSLDQDILNKQLRVPGPVEAQVLHLATLARQAGCDGIVCSAADLYAIRSGLPDDFLFVTPGIEGPRTPAGADQKRVFTPGRALRHGSSILVIGRAITGAADRVQAARDVLQDMTKDG